jgi:hypothetical protein
MGRGEAACFQFVSADAAHAWVHAYYNAITKRLRKLADYQINPNMALVSFFMCAKTDEEARARADGATFFQFALRAPTARFHTSHIDQVILLNQAGKNTHEHIRESLELFAREVLPEFERDGEHDAWKQP